MAQEVHNQLTDVEKKQGWKLLFDGVSTTGWRNYGKKTIGEAWKVEDGTLRLKIDPNQKAEWHSANGGDIITDKSYQNYELALEWKIAPNGNSGIIFNVFEDEKYKYPWQTGPEMQILDNEGHPDAKIHKHRAGDLYDLMVSKEAVKPAGEWNKVKILNNKGVLLFYLNNQKVLSIVIGNGNWKKLIEGSKFKDMKGFGTFMGGHIALQDHGDNVWYRNIKIRRIK